MTGLTHRQGKAMWGRIDRPAQIAAGVALLLLVFRLPSLAAPPEDQASAEDTAEQAKPAIERELVTGKVVLLGEAIKHRELRVAEEMADQAVLETPEGDLIPLLADWRGRAFFQDERLRNRKVELVAYRREKLPYLQVLMVFTFNEEDERQYTDYWCDVCSIPMYEIKACECCQGDIRLRFQPLNLPDYLQVDDVESSGTESSGTMDE